MKKKRILIVDDDVEFCEEIEEVLRLEGYSVTRTSDSVQGAKLIKKGVYDIYLFDYKMPVLSGIDLLKKAKKKNPAGAVYIISGKPFVEKGLSKGNFMDIIAGIIKKPFSAEVLLQKIGTLA